LTALVAYDLHFCNVTHCIGLLCDSLIAITDRQVLFVAVLDLLITSELWFGQEQDGILP